MLNSQRIKLLATNNLQHINFTSKPPLQTQNKNVSIQQSIQIQQPLQYLKMCENQKDYCQEEESQEFQGFDQYDTEQLLQKGMFTIREQQSFEISSHNSALKQNKVYISSQIFQDISTIKVSKDESEIKTIKREQGEDIQSFYILDKNDNDKLLQSPYPKPTKQSSPQKLPEFLTKQAQTTKIPSTIKQNQNPPIFQPIQQNQQKQLQINFNEIVLPTGKMKLNSQFNILHSADLNTKNNVGIIYECNHVEFQKILKILEDQGIRVVEQPRKIDMKLLLSKQNSSCHITQYKDQNKQNNKNTTKNTQTPVLKNSHLKLSITKQSFFSSHQSIIQKKIHILHPAGHSKIKKKKGINMISAKMRAIR